MTIKTFIMLQKIYIQINAVLLNFIFIKEPEKKIYSAVFNIIIIIIIIINVF